MFSFNPICINQISKKSSFQSSTILWSQRCSKKYQSTFENTTSIISAALLFSMPGSFRVLRSKDYLAATANHNCTNQPPRNFTIIEAQKSFPVCTWEYAPLPPSYSPRLSTSHGSVIVSPMTARIDWDREVNLGWIIGGLSIKSGSDSGSDSELPYDVPVEEKNRRAARRTEWKVVSGKNSENQNNDLKRKRNVNQEGFRYRFLRWLYVVGIGWNDCLVRFR